MVFDETTTSYVITHWLFTEGMWSCSIKGIFETDLFIYIVHAKEQNKKLFLGVHYWQAHSGQNIK